MKIEKRYLRDKCGDSLNFEFEISSSILLLVNLDLFPY